MTRSCTASASAKPARCWPRCRTGWIRSGCGCIPTRRGSCTARTGSGAAAYEHTSFTFLGYTFRPRGARAKDGRRFPSFSPAISRDALNKIGREVRSWRLHRRIGQTFADLARWINPIVRGWMQYYGAFYRSALYPLLTRINAYLMRWVRKKYHRFQGRRQLQQAWQRVTTQYPRFFAHWAWTTASPPSGDQGDKSRMNREVHVRICGSRRVRLPPATRPHRVWTC